MITIKSTVNKAYSVSVYPEAQYQGGNGYFFHYTCGGPKGSVIVPSDLPKEVLSELRPKANKACWGK